MSRKRKKHARKAAAPQPLQATMSYGSYDAATLPLAPVPLLANHAARPRGGCA